jgi:hypothetical protein
MSNESPKQRQDRPGALSRLIEDPFGALCAGLIAQIATFALLFAGMFGLSQIA